ncbi:MAG: hypothetical protein IPK12_01225 [Gemmatimonadetes bacterium]|nr:hypothetical protein [Gemmatimonadota bacterium]
MTGTDLRRRRLALNWTPEKLGELLAESGDRITGWEDLDGPLPRPIVRQMEWALAVGERDKAMEACPVPPCEVAERIGATIDPRQRSSVERVMAEFDVHEKGCSACQARKAYADRLPPLPPFPMPGGMRAVVAVAEQVRRLPAWLRPAAAGALIMGAMTLFKALLTILLQRRVTPQLLLAVAAAIGIGAYGGAVGGLAYSVVRPRTRSPGPPRRRPHRRRLRLGLRPRHRHSLSPDHRRRRAPGPRDHHRRPGHRHRRGRGVWPLRLPG